MINTKPGINEKSFKITLEKDWLANKNAFKSDLDIILERLEKYPTDKLLEAIRGY